MGIYCPYCNRLIPSDSNICPYCTRQINQPLRNQPQNQIPMQPQKKNNNLIIIIVVVIAVLLIAIVAISATVYVYVSGNLGTPPEIPISINFMKDNAERKMTVVAFDSDDSLWRDFEIKGNCDTSNLGPKVDLGDTITNCYETIIIIHIPTNTLIGQWEFK